MTQQTNIVLKYERSAAVNQRTKTPSVSESSSAEPIYFMHHVADNTNRNHNPRALNGCNTFYGVGITCSVTPAFPSSFAIPCLEDLSAEHLIKPTKIEHKTLPSKSRLLRLKFIKLNKPVNAFDPRRFTWAATRFLSP